jgi:hypothetical protein
MSADRLAALTARAEQVHARYRHEFAGRSRIGRDAGALDAMVADLQQVKVEADALEGASQLLAALDERISLYRTERQAITEAAAGGPDLARAFRLHDWSWLDSRRYSRHFAGKPRPTRDLGLLEEMIAAERLRKDELERIAARHEAGWRADSIEAMQKGIDLYTSERAAVLDARKQLSIAERAQVLATCANNQFSLYRAHFEGQARRTRRAALLERLLVQLEDIAAGMEAAQRGGLVSDANQGNVQKVRDRIAHHRAELGKVKQARATTRPGELSGALGDEANNLFKEYRAGFAGKSRAQVDPDALSDICDKLYMVARNMEGLAAETGIDLAEKNLAITIDNLKAYEREWSRIQAARQG